MGDIWDIWIYVYARISDLACMHAREDYKETGVLVQTSLAVAWTTAISSLSSYYPVTIIYSFLHFMLVEPLLRTRSCQDPWEIGFLEVTFHSCLLPSSPWSSQGPQLALRTVSHHFPPAIWALVALCILIPLGLGTCCSGCLEHCSSSVSTRLVCSSVPASGEHL